MKRSMAIVAGLVGVCIAARAPAQFNSTFPAIRVEGTFCGTNGAPNLTLVSNGLWQGFFLVTNQPVSFVFAAAEDGPVWGDANPAGFSLPLSGAAETGAVPAIAATGVFGGILRLRFNESTWAYSAVDVSASDGRPWINELHYDDNANPEVNEGVEIAGPAGLDLSAYQLAFYDGNPAVLAVYTNLALSGVLTNQQNGFGFRVFSMPGIQNGAPDGVALARIAGGTTTVVQLVSYEGTFTPVNGPAQGLTSLDLGVAEPATNPPGQSLQATGSGVMGLSFRWVGPVAATPQAANVGQAVASNPAASVTATNLMASPAKPGPFTPIHLFANLSGAGGASNLAATALVRANASGPFVPYAMTLLSGNVYRTAAAIPGQLDGTLLRWYIHVNADGGGTNTPTVFPSGAPASTTMVTAVLSVAPGAVFLNEFNTFNQEEWFDPDTNEFIEIAGLTGSGLGGWKIQLFPDGSPYPDHEIVLPSNAVLLADNAGYGFYVVGDPGVSNRDFTFPFSAPAGDHLPLAGAIRLLNKVGDVFDYVSYGSPPPTGIPPGARYVGFDDDFESVTMVLAASGRGGAPTGFPVWATNNVASPGAANLNQTFVGGNTGGVPPFILCPPDLVLCPSQPVPTANVATVTAQNLCGTGGVTVTWVGDTTNSGSGCLTSPKVIARRYRAVSTCASTSECVQTITIADREPPSLSYNFITLANPGFELGDLAGWKEAGRGFVASVVDWDPRSGFRHARMTGGDRAVQDSSGNGFVGLLSGNVTTFQLGATARTTPAMRFDGANGQISVPFQTELNAVGFTVAAWVNVLGSSTNQRTLVSSHDGPGGTNNRARGFVLSASPSNDWVFSTGYGSGDHVLRAGRVPMPGGTGLWTHVVATLDPVNRIKALYTNGVLAGASNITTYVPNNLQPLILGAGQDVTNPVNLVAFLPGLLDDVQLYGRALSGSEVGLLYAGGQGGTNVSDRAAHYMLNEDFRALADYASIYQDFAAASGQTWFASIYALVPSTEPLTSSNECRLALEFLSASNVVIGATTSTAVRSNTPKDVYSALAVSYVAPSNTAKVRFNTLFLKRSPAAGPGYVYLDDAVLSAQVVTSGVNCAVMSDFRPLVLATDNCGVVILTQDPPVGAYASPSNGYVIVTATDPCGLSTSAVVPIIVQDLVPPVVSVVPRIDAACTNDIPPPSTNGMVISDSCGDVLVSYEGDAAILNPYPFGCFASPIRSNLVNRIWTATDMVGNSTVFTQKVVLIDTNPPVLVVLPAPDVANAGFESGSLSGWSVEGTAYADVVATAPHEGVWHARLRGRSDGSTNTVRLYQDLPADIGQTWLAAAFVSVSPTNALGSNDDVRLYLEVYNSVTDLMTFVQSGSLDGSSARDFYHLLYANYGLVPGIMDGVAFVRLVIEYTQRGGTSGEVFVDQTALLMNAAVADGSGYGTIPEIRGLAAVTECSLAYVTSIPPVGASAPIGTNIVRLIARDNCRRETTGETAVVVFDFIPPTIVACAPSRTFDWMPQLPDPDPGQVEVSDNGQVVVFHVGDVVVQNGNGSGANPYIIDRTYRVLDTGGFTTDCTCRLTVSGLGTNTVPPTPPTLRIVDTYDDGTNRQIAATGSNTWYVRPYVATNPFIDGYPWVRMARDGYRSTFYSGTNFVEIFGRFGTGRWYQVRLQQEYP